MAEHEKVHVICENLCLEEGMTKEQIERLVGTVASGSPLVASSISDMTDTTRIYVNTTDGHWYWYNGSSWMDGGVYQAAEDSDTVNVLKDNVDEINKSNNYGSVTPSVEWINRSVKTENGEIGSSDNLKRATTTNTINVYPYKEIKIELPFNIDSATLFKYDEYDNFIGYNSIPLNNIYNLIRVDVKDLKRIRIVMISNSEDIDLTLLDDVIVLKTNDDIRINELNNKIVQISDFVSPEMFGAVGDGVKDDTTALQNTIDYCLTNKVNFKAPNGKIYAISRCLQIVGQNEEEDLGGTTYTVKGVHSNFDFGNSIIKMKATNNSDVHKVKFISTEYPCCIYYKNTNNDRQNAVISNLVIDCNNTSAIGIYFEEMRKTIVTHVEIKNVKIAGMFLAFTSGNCIEKVVIKASRDNATGIVCAYNSNHQTAQDNHFTDIFMLDVKTAFDCMASMNYFTRCHPFMRTKSFITGSTVFKLRNYDYEGVSRGICTPILTDCYFDTYQYGFDVSDHENHRVISKGLTMLWNTSNMTEFMNTYGQKYLYLCKTGNASGYLNKIKILNSFLSGFVYNNILCTRLSDTGELQIDETYSVLNNINRDLD